LVAQAGEASWVAGEDVILFLLVVEFDMRVSPTFWQPTILL